MKELTQSDMVAVDAAVKILLHTSFGKDPVLTWVRKVESLLSFSNVAHVKVTFWAFGSPDLKLTVSTILEKRDEKILGWVAYAAMLRIYSGEPELWLFGEDGIPVREH